jgi:shikimate 5-dehydrogenase
MFVNQAVAQFERWTTKPAPRGVMREVVARKLGALNGN